MAGLFCLGNRDQPSKQENEDHRNNRSLFLYRSADEIANTTTTTTTTHNKGFEIWPQQYHQNQNHHGFTNYMSFGGNSNSADEATTTPNPPARAPKAVRNYSFNINDVVDEHQNSPSAINLGFLMRPGNLGVGIGSSSASGSASGMNCQDCGNQAKKDCSHMRCRTCCKSRGFQCTTHVKSTWVPAAKRRERQQQLASLQQLQQQHEQDPMPHQHHHHYLTKRHRDSSSSNPTTRNLAVTTTGLELGGVFPAEVNSPAVFRCVRVSAMDDEDEHFAYQTAVNIGGHTFKGILYDEGPDGHFTTHSGGGGSQGRGDDVAATATTQQFNLISSAATTNQSVSFLDASLVYPTPMNAFMAGTQFFPPPR